MPITDGYSQYLCPGCGKEEFLGRNDATKKGKWQERSRINADKVTENYSFCEDCAPEYDSLIKQHDQEVLELLASLTKTEE